MLIRPSGILFGPIKIQQIAFGPALYYYFNNSKVSFPPSFSFNYAPRIFCLSVYPKTSRISGWNQHFRNYIPVLSKIFILLELNFQNDETKQLCAFSILVHVIFFIVYVGCIFYLF